MSVSIEAMLLGIMKGHSFLRDFEIKRYIKRYVKIPCKLVFLPIRALLGNLDGIHLLVLFERKEKYSWVPFLDPEDIMIFKFGGHLELW